MPELAWLWIPATIAAAAAQTARNAMQRHLIAELGTVGATHVRFLYGAPFSLLFLAVILAATGEAIPPIGREVVPFLIAGAAAQVLATALMLAAMGMANFSIAITYTKTEPVQVAIFGLVILGEALGLLSVVAIIVATAGILVMSTPYRRLSGPGALRAALLGLGSGAMFAISATSFRGAILSFEEGSFLMRATTTLVWGLWLQAAAITAYMAAFDRPALAAIARAWRGSVFAGFMGALASFFWFIAFSLTAIAHVRTLALIEVLFAYFVSGRIFAQRAERHEIAGMVLVVGGVALLLLATAGR
jgi:drug/metabolite transporter (DMT)-like permease